MTTLKRKSLSLIREEGFSYLANKDKLSSYDIQAQPIQNNWIFVDGYYSTDAGTQRLDINITNPKEVITGEHLGRFEPTMTDIINQSPELLAEIKEARADLKNNNFSSYEDIFGK